MKNVNRSILEPSINLPQDKQSIKDEKILSMNFNK